MERVKVARVLVSLFAALIAVAYAPPAAPADTTGTGVVVIPVEEDTAAFDAEALGDATKGGIALRRSHGGEMAQRLQRAVQSGRVPVKGFPVAGKQTRGERSGRDEDTFNVQVNDPAFDRIVTFDPKLIVTRPFELALVSETSAVKDGKDVVVGYNSAEAEVQFFPGFGLAYTRVQWSAFSTSHDGGRTWAEGFVPPVSEDAPFTFGDPSLAIDRNGNIFYASLGINGIQGPTPNLDISSAMIINKSTDHGSSFGPATVVAVDKGVDKGWLAIGPDPTVPSRDNVYVTWTSFKRRGTPFRSSDLWLARSTDGGQTFSSLRLFAPIDDGTNTAIIQYSNPVVDASTGRLYIPFLHFSYLDADNVRVLVSDDGGNTFRFLAFNVPGAVDAFAFPTVSPGRINDCTSGRFQNALVAGVDQGGGRFGFPRFRQATRLITQPHAAAARGTFLFVLNNSTSPFFGDPAAGSEIKLVFSPDGGQSWAPTFRVVASTAADPQHVHPAVSLSRDAKKLAISYYVQQADSRLRTDVAIIEINDGHVRLKKTAPLSSTAFDLTPSNVVLRPTETTNFDRTASPCYDIGEYQTLARSLRDDDDSVIAAWGDNRRSWVSPSDSPAAGPHSKPDVFSATIDATVGF